MGEPRQIAVVRTYDDLVLAFRERAEELEYRRQTIDDIARLADGHSSKLLAYPPLKILGRVSLGPMLEALGLTIILMDNPEALAKFGQDRVKRKPRGGHSKPLRIKNGSLDLLTVMRNLGSKGGNARKRKLSAKEQSELARRAIKSRWRGVRRKRTKEAIRKRQKRAAVSALKVDMVGSL